jgi:hypothetical protein
MLSRRQYPKLFLIQDRRWLHTEAEETHFTFFDRPAYDSAGALVTCQQTTPQAQGSQPHQGPRELAALERDGQGGREG